MAQKWPTHCGLSRRVCESLRRESLVKSMHREGSEEGQIKERADLLALPFDFPLRFSGVLQWSPSAVDVSCCGMSVAISRWLEKPKLRWRGRCCVWQIRENWRLSPWQKTNATFLNFSRKSSISSRRAVRTIGSHTVAFEVSLPGLPGLHQLRLSYRAHPCNECRLLGFVAPERQAAGHTMPSGSFE